jgi:hypothetical protein
MDDDSGWNLGVIPDKLKPYISVFEDAGSAHGFNPKVLMAIAMQENVAPGDMNPLGISDDSGPHHYGSPEEAEAAIHRQVAVMTSPTGPYRNVRNLNDLAAVYSPVGASNDPYGTNSGEASGIIANLAKLGVQDASLNKGDSSQQYIPHTEEEWAKIYAEDDPNLKEKEEQKPTDFNQPNEQTEKPTDVLGPDFMLQQIRKQHPEYGHFTNEELIDKFQKRYDTPLKQLRALYPQYDESVPDDQEFGEKIRAKFFPDLNADDFKDKFNPPTGVEGAIHNFIKPLWPNLAKSWHGSMGNLAKFPERADEAIDWLQKQDWIKGLMDADTKMPGMEGYKSVRDQYEHSIRDGVKNLYEAGQEQAKKAQKIKTPDPVGIAGHLGAVTGQAIGSTPEAIVSFMPVIGPAASLTLGMTYNAVTAAAEAKDAGQDTGLAQGWVAGGVRAVQQWVLESPRGRLLTGVYNAALGMGDEQAQRFLNGDTDNDVDKTAASGAVNFIIGVMGAHGTEKLNPAAKEIYFDAVKARDEGDYQKAGALLDKSQLFLKDTDRAEISQLMLKWTDDVIPLTDQKALPAPRAERVTPTEPSGPPISPPRARDKVKDQSHILPYDPKSVPPKFEENMTDQFYYSGITPDQIGKMFEHYLTKGREFAKEHIKPTTDIWHRSWDPENISEIHARAGSIIAEQNASFAEKRQRLVNAYIHNLKQSDEFRFSEDQTKRKAFWNKFTDSKLKDFAEKADEGKPTGDRVVDRMIAINKGVYAGIAKMDAAHDITYPLRDTYVYRVLKHPEDIAKVDGIINRQRWGDPRFMKPREVEKLSTLHKFGIEMKTYNQEDIVQMRMDDSLRAISRVNALRDMANDGLAWPAKDLKATPKAFQDQIMAQSNDVRSPNGEHFWVHKDADFMLHRAWDPSMVRGTAVDKFAIEPLNYIKQKTVGIRLGLSLFHHLHMLDIGSASMLATVEKRFLDGTLTGKQIGDALKDIASGGIVGHVKAIKGYSRLLDFYHGKGVDFKDLSPEEQQQYRYQQMGGLAPVVSHEREKQLMAFINKTVPVAGRAADATLDLGYKWLTGGPYQPWLFQHVVPSLKMAAFDAEAKAVMDAKPWLLNPRSDSDLRLELRKIGKSVDSRFGEMNYDNLFWPKITKILGQNLLLSLGWKLGFWRTYAGAVHSVMDSAAHMDEIIKTYRGEGARKAAQRVASNQLLYGMNYTALTMAKNLIATAIFGGGALTLMDALYPRIGKNPDGTDKRLKTPFFTGELGALYQLFQKDGGLGTAVDYFRNSMQPALSSIAELANNKDYRGTEIRNPHESLLNQIGESAGFVLSQMVPFSIESGVLRPKPGATWVDRVLPFFGLPPAAAWTSRTDIANKIINRYAERHGSGSKTQTMQDQVDARTALREALVNKDQASAKEALKRMRDLGMSQQSIHNVEKTKDQTTDERLFPHLDALDQEELLKGMSESERAHYLPLASKKVKAKFQHELEYAAQ